MKMKFQEFVELNPKVSLQKGAIYSFIPMEYISPGYKYPKSINEKMYRGGGAKFQNNDVIFARITPCLENGKIAKVKNLRGNIGFGSTEFFVFRSKEGISDSDYVYYLSLTNLIRKTAEKSMTGASGRQRANLNSIKNLEFDFPSLPTQRKIASILSAYDDLIENNTRRIKILEEIAQAIYKEWFVNFRFPGHEKVKLVDSPLGKIPEGWTIVPINSFCEIVKGKSYRKAELVSEGGLPFVNLKCVARGGGFKIEGLKRFSGSYKESQVVEKGDIVVAVTDMTQQRDIVARVARIPKMNESKMVISLDIVRLKISNRSINYPFLYTMLRYSNFGYELKEFANGANVLHLNPKHIGDYNILLPTKELIHNAGEIFEEITNSIDIYNLKNTNLRKTRDLLLPKLISGEVEV